MNTPAISARRILGLALPAAGEQFLVFGVILFDTALIGRLGAAYLSSQAVVAHWVQLNSVVFNVMAVGGSILVAQAVGQRNESAVDVVLGATLALALISGVGVTLLVALLAPLLIGLMGVDNTIRDLAIPYLRLLALSFPLNFVLLSAGGCIRGVGDTRTPLLVMLTANAVHVFAALALTFGAIPGLGLHGIALATILSRGVGAALIAGLLIRGVAGLRLNRSRLRLQAMRQVWRMGSGVAGEQLALRLGQLVNLRLITGLGTQTLAAYVVVLNTQSLILTLGLGFMAAALTMIGQQIGAGSGEAVQRTGWRTVQMAWLVMGGLALLFAVWPGATRLFSNDAAVLSLAAAVLPVLMLGIPFEAANQVLTGGIRGVGDTRYSMWVTALGHWLVRLPLILLFVGPLGLGLVGVCAAMVIEMGVRAALNTWRFRSGFWLSALRLRVSEP